MNYFKRQLPCVLKRDLFGISVTLKFIGTEVCLARNLHVSSGSVKNISGLFVVFMLETI